MKRKINSKIEKLDDSQMQNTIGCTVKTSDGITHAVNVCSKHPCPVSQAMAYVSAKYRKQKKYAAIIEAY
jgi:hypothetical protein